MTKKDYILIANVLNTLIRATREVDNNNETELVKNAMHGKNISMAIYMFCTKLSEDNPRFDWDRFQKAVNQ